ncbi:MAG TPA: TIGR03435 family protein, partial [Bryobacteraceae bacterium]
MATLIVGLLSVALAIAQPSFEIASIKANISRDRSSYTRRGEDSLALQNWSLRDIVLKAYDLKNYALNAPDWLASRNFDINAKASGKVTEGQLRQMLQSLLKDRLQMKVHPASKEVQAYALIPAKGGLKLKPVHDDGVFGVDVSHFPDKTRVACR